MNDNSTHPNKMRHPRGALSPSREADPRQPHPCSLRFDHRQTPALVYEPRPSRRVKELWPLMNTDKRGLKTRFLSAFICVHRRPKLIFPQRCAVA